MKLRTVLLPVAACLLALSACGPADSSSETRPDKTYDGELQTFSSASAAMAFARSRAAQCDTAITMRIPGATLETAQNIASTLGAEGAILSAKTMAFAGLVVIEPQYSEESLLLRAYRNPAIEASLTPSQKGALAKARAAVQKACSQYSSDYDRARALHDYLVKNTTYSHSTVAKNLNTCTTAVLQSGEGVCEGYTRAYRLLLDMAGIENRYVGGTAQGESHCWNLVRLSGQWVHIDCTYDDPMPDAVDRALHTYFAMSDAQIAANHTWSRGSVPAAPSSALYAPFRNGWHFATMQDFVNHCANHKMPAGYITVYIDELGRSGANAHALLDAAQRRLGRQVVFKYVTTPSSPCAFSCICDY